MSAWFGFLIYLSEQNNNYSCYDMTIVTAVISFYRQKTPIQLQVTMGLELELNWTWIGLGLELQQP